MLPLCAWGARDSIVDYGRQKMRRRSPSPAKPSPSKTQVPGSGVPTAALLQVPVFPKSSQVAPVQTFQDAFEAISEKNPLNEAPEPALISIFAGPGRLAGMMLKPPLVKMKRFGSP